MPGDCYRSHRGDIALAVGGCKGKIAGMALDIIEVFELQLDAMRRQLSKEGKNKEYVRIEVMGLEVFEIVRRRQSGVLVLRVLDENDKESLLIIHEGHFSAKLSFAKEKPKRPGIGFKAIIEEG